MAPKLSPRSSLIDRVAGSVCEVATSRPVFHLTFDDGPHPEVTPRVLDLLDEVDARATFFLLTDHARRHSEVAGEVLRRGHEVGLHGRSHLRLSAARWSALVEEILDAKEELQRVVGRTVEYFRPPYGDHSLRSLAVAQASGLKTILWSVDTFDWKGIRSQPTLRANLHAMGAGGIGLMHDTPIGESLADEQARGLLPRDDIARMVLERLDECGLRAVSLDELLGSGEVIRRFRPLMPSSLGDSWSWVP